MSANFSTSVLVIGGGPAGFFSANHCADYFKGKITIVEGGSKVLGKVLISGGGRCNVTNRESEPQKLAANYPRGAGFLTKAFSFFSSKDTQEWFKKRGVSLKTEPDGRVFPTTDRSETIANCLERSALESGVEIKTGWKVKDIQKKSEDWIVESTSGAIATAQHLIVCSGSNAMVWSSLEKLNHTIVEPVPSLFTLNCSDPLINVLPGVSTEVILEGKGVQTSGPLLFTHKGFSGPSVLRLSAWGALTLAQVNYKFKLKVNFLQRETSASVMNQFQQLMASGSKEKVFQLYKGALPKRLYQALWDKSEIPSFTNWSELGKKRAKKWCDILTQCSFDISGKSTFKEEFVTAGGVDLEEIEVKTMGSKVHQGLFFAGEVMNVDGITGGFNFQASWTSGYLAGKSAANSINNLRR